MCVYLNEIEDTVKEFVNSDTMFTAWDVTVALRKRSKNNIQHYEVKKEVHQMFDQGNMTGYNRHLANLPNVNSQPWIYYSPSVDPTIYTGKPIVPTAAVVLPSPTSSMSSVDSTDDGSDVAADGSLVYKFDTTDRLCVPNKLIRELNLKVGDEVDVVYTVPTTSEVCVVPKGGLPGLSSIATYVVDKYDNVRISRAALTKIGINGIAFEIERHGTAIKIKKYA